MLRLNPTQVTVDPIVHQLNKNLQLLRVDLKRCQEELQKKNRIIDTLRIQGRRKTEYDWDVLDDFFGNDHSLDELFRTNRGSKKLNNKKKLKKKKSSKSKKYNKGQKYKKDKKDKKGKKSKRR